MKSPLPKIVLGFLLCAFCLTACKKDAPGNPSLFDNPETTEDLKPKDHFLTVSARYDKSEDRSTVSLQVRPYDETGFPLEISGGNFYAVNGSIVPTPSILWASHHISFDGMLGITEVNYHTNETDHFFTFDPMPEVTITSQHNTLSLTQGDTVFFDTAPLQIGERVEAYIRQATPFDTVWVSFEKENPTDNFIVLDWQRLTSAPLIEGAAEIRVNRYKESYLQHESLAGIRFRQNTRDRQPAVLSW